MLITNYSNEANTIYINQPTGGAVNYCMANLPVDCLTANATISGTQTIQAPQSANLTFTFTDTNPWTYTLSNGTSVTTLNSAYQFSGSSSSYVSIANPNNFTTNNYTYSGWIKATTLSSGTAWIFGIGQGGVRDQSLYLSYYNGAGPCLC